jgi:UDP-arabinose 4-epimerase
VNVLVTGGAGYVGSHACKALKLAGHKPVVFDNLVYGHRDFVKWGPLIEGELSNEALLSTVIREHGIEAVMHFAAYAYVGESVADPEKYYFNNVVGTLALLRAMRAANVKTMVFSSTCATYGQPDEMPLRETTPQRPINPYGRSKLIVEQILQDYATAYGLRAIALRYFNASGADEDGEIGEWHEPETHLIPLAIEAALSRGSARALTVFGTDYPTTDGTCERDYVHVSDLAQGHVAALQHLTRSSGVPGAAAEGASPGVFLAFNLGTGRSHSVRAVLQEIERAAGTAVPVMVGDRRPGDPPQLVADPSKAREVLGWNAQRGLKEIVSSAVAWSRTLHNRNH